MANSLLTPTVVTKEALRILVNNLSMGKNVTREYDKNFAQSGAKVGTTLTVRKPNRFAVSSGAALNVQDLDEPSDTVVVNSQRHVDFNFTSADLTLTIDEFSDRYIKPAMARLADEIDKDGLAQYKYVSNLVGTPATTPASALVYLQAAQKLNEFAAPMDGQRCAIINPAAEAATVNALTGLFHSSSEVAKQYESGMMGQAFGFKFYMDQNVARHTVGSDVTTVTVNDTVASGDSVITLAGATMVAGDVFTIASVNAVNPSTKISTGSAQQFTVLSVSGNDYTVSPSFISSGAYQTIDALPANSAAVTAVGTASTGYPMNLAFHRDAFILATADLVLPQGVDFSARENYEGISLRVVRQYDINNDAFPCRIDVLYGWKTIRPEWACRIIG